MKKKKEVVDSEVVIIEKDKLEFEPEVKRNLINDDGTYTFMFLDKIKVTYYFNSKKKKMKAKRYDLINENEMKRIEKFSELDCFEVSDGKYQEIRVYF